MTAKPNADDLAAELFHTLITKLHEHGLSVVDGAAITAAIHAAYVRSHAITEAAMEDVTELATSIVGHAIKNDALIATVSRHVRRAH